MRMVWSVRLVTRNYYDYNLIWKWWLALKSCQRVVERRLHGWRCLWVKTPVNPVCTLANRGGWSETKQLLNSMNEGEYSSSLCECIWDLSDLGGGGMVGWYGGWVGVFSFPFYCILFQCFNSRVIWWSYCKHQRLNPSCLVNETFLSAIKLASYWVSAIWVKVRV